MRNVLLLIVIITQTACGSLLLAKNQSLPSLPTLYVPDYPLLRVDNTFREELESSFRLVQKPDQADYLLLISPSRQGLQVTLIDLISHVSTVNSYCLLSGQRKALLKMIAHDVCRAVRSPLIQSINQKKEIAI